MLQITIWYIKMESSSLIKKELTVSTFYCSKSGYLRVGGGGIYTSSYALGLKLQKITLHKKFKQTLDF